MAMLPLLTGTRTLEEVVGSFDARAATAVVNALQALADNDLLTEGLTSEKSAIGDSASFFASTGSRMSSAEALERLAAARLGVAGNGTPAGPIISLLVESGVGQAERTELSELHDSQDDLALTIVVPSPEETTKLADWNRRALKRSCAWQLILPFDGLGCIIGPIFQPGETCCYECFRIRRSLASGSMDDFWLFENTQIAALQAPWIDSIAAGIAVDNALRWIVGSNRSPGDFSVVEQSPRLALTRHTAFRVPRCPACSSVSQTSIPAFWYEGGVDREPHA